MQILAIVVGVGVVAITAVLAKIFIDKKAKKVTLEDPNKKYPLKLIERQEISHDTRWENYLSFLLQIQAIIRELRSQF